jgi:hypothetical protein
MPVERMAECPALFKILSSTLRLPPDLNFDDQARAIEAVLEAAVDAYPTDEVKAAAVVCYLTKPFAPEDLKRLLSESGIPSKTQKLGYRSKSVRLFLAGLCVGIGFRQARTRQRKFAEALARALRSYLSEHGEAAKSVVDSLKPPLATSMLTPPSITDSEPTATAEPQEQATAASKSERPLNDASPDESQERIRLSTVLGGEWISFKDLWARLDEWADSKRPQVVGWMARKARARYGDRSTAALALLLGLDILLILACGFFVPLMLDTIVAPYLPASSREPFAALQSLFFTPFLPLLVAIATVALTPLVFVVLLLTERRFERLIAGLTAAFVLLLLVGSGMSYSRETQEAKTAAADFAHSIGVHEVFDSIGCPGPDRVAEGSSCTVSDTDLLLVGSIAYQPIYSPIGDYYAETRLFATPETSLESCGVEAMTTNGIAFLHLEEVGRVDLFKTYIAEATPRTDGFPAPPPGSEIEPHIAAVSLGRSDELKFVDRPTWFGEDYSRWTKLALHRSGDTLTLYVNDRVALRLNQSPSEPAGLALAVKAGDQAGACTFDYLRVFRR